MAHAPCEAAVGAGDHVLRAGDLGVAGQALGRKFRVLDDVEWPTTPGISVAPSGSFTSSQTAHSCSCLGLAASIE